MKNLCRGFLSILLPGLVAFAQHPPDQHPPAQGREVYHIEFVRAAPGKLPELLEAVKAGPHAPHSPRHFVFRHEQGDHWDLMILDPMGTGERVEALNQPDLQSWLNRMRALQAWHTDTFASGPPLAVVRKSLALGQERPGAPAIYEVGDYLAAAGHRDELDKLLSRLASGRPERSVIFEHLEGAAWDFVTVNRFDSWHDFADQQRESDARARKAGFANAATIALELRQHMASHHDTFVSRVP
jgi:hypothetical protein